MCFGLALNSAGWLMLVFATLGLVALRGKFPWLVQFPPEYIVPVDQWTNVAVQAVIADLKPLMRTFSDRIADVLNQIRGFFIWLPWSTFVVVIATLGAVAGGWRLAALAFGCLLYIAFAGFWTATMATLAALVIIVPLSIVLGFSLGLVAFYVPSARRIIMATLDLMQTIPAFSYLLPFLVMFGAGPAVGVLASIIFATPPMVRSVCLGLTRVDPDSCAAGRMSGCSEAQLLWFVQLPAARETVLLGVNQVIMASLSMVIISSVTGGFADIGWEVLSAIRKAQVGEGCWPAW